MKKSVSLAREQKPPTLSLLSITRTNPGLTFILYRSKVNVETFTLILARRRIPLFSENLPYSCFAKDIFCARIQLGTVYMSYVSPKIWICDPPPPSG